MTLYSRLLLENKAWAAEKIESDPDYFERMAHTQAPKFLWVGCSDSRVPANEVTGTLPGELFVHRNIANLVVENDNNFLSVLEYAVAHLKVEHIIVCGHYGCGGVNAALTDKSFGIIDPWLSNIKNVVKANQDILMNIADPVLRSDRLVEMSVEQQVKNLTKTDTIKKAWSEEQRPHIHGWVYNLKDGLIRQICNLEPGRSEFLRREEA